MTSSPPARLSLAQRTRPGTADGTKTERVFFDFVVDGRSLFDELGAQSNDLVSCLWVEEGPVDVAARERLLLRAPADLPGGRVSFFVCPECGDLGCGGISAQLTRDGPRIIWSEFGYQNDYDPEVIPRPGVGPFEFVFDEYAAVLAYGPYMTSP